MCVINHPLCIDTVIVSSACCCFVNVRVFNPFASSNVNSVSAAYRCHENTKRRAYGQRIQEIELASFTPIVISAAGGLASEATTFYKRLASLLASKWGDEYCVVMGWLHCSLSFSLLQSTIVCVRGVRAWCACVRGAHSSIGHFHKATSPLNLVWVEANMITEN